MKTITFFSLLHRGFFIALMLYLMALWIDEALNENIDGVVNMLIFWTGAWFWESVMYLYNRWKNV
jgi:hypothetical protein